MAARWQRRSHKQRWGWLAVLTTLALGLGLFGLTLDTPATAAVSPSSFNATDGVLDTSGSGRLVARIDDEPSGNQDNSYAGDGAAEPDLCPAVDVDHAVPAKADIDGYWVGTDTAAPGVVYLAWHRVSTNGTLAVDFEFNQAEAGCGNGVNKVRTAGDLLVVYEFSGGSIQAIELRTWTGSDWSAPVALPAGSHDEKISADLFFGELTINLVSTHILDGAACKSFGSGFAKSRTGGSFETSKIKDYVAPIETGISNCGTLKIVKDARPDSGDDFAFTAAGSLNNTTEVPPTFTLDDDADAALANNTTILAHPQTVTVTEGSYAPTWNLIGLTCTGPGSDDVSISVPNRQVVADLEATDDITCTYVNSKPSTITIIKDAQPNNGRDFDFTGTGTGVAPTFKLDDDADGALPRQRDFGNLADGTYTVQEGAATGWLLSNINCGGATNVTYESSTGTPVPGSAYASGHNRVKIAVAAGSSVACTFTNVKIPPTILTTKDANPTSIGEPGGNITFAVSVKNTSPLPVKITDLIDDVYGDLTLLAPPALGTQCAIGTTLNPNDVYSCSFVGAVMGNAGTIHTDTVTAKGVDSDGVPVQDDDDAVVTITDVLPKIAVTKTPSKTLIHKGDPVTYTYVVTNPGVEPLTVTMSDDKCSPVQYQSGDTANMLLLDPTETWTFTCTPNPALTATTTNIITATGTDDEKNQVKATATATVTVLDPAIAVTKQASAGAVHAGDPVTYTYNVTNTGTATPLTGVTIGDDKCGSITGPTGDTAPLGTLSTGETWVYTCVMPLTTTTKNIVTVSGTDGLGKVVTNTANATVGVIVPQIDVTKTPSATTIHAGDSVTYTYKVTNPGNAELATVKLVDDKCATVTGPAAGGDTDNDGKLDVGETWTYTCTQALAATTTNVATVSGVDPLGKTVTDTATATVTVIAPAIAITKTPSLRSVDPGTTVVYTYTVTNPGDVALSKVTVADDKCSPVTFVGGDTNADGLLQKTETWTFRCSQVQTGAVDTLTNVGTATGTDPLGKVVTSNDTVTVTVVAPLVIAQAPAPAPAPAPAVAPVIVTLPRTGMDVRGWLEVGGSLILLGLALLVTTRRRRLA